MSKLEVLIIAIIVMILISIPIVFEKECEAKAIAIGVNSEWSFIGGCVIEYKKGKWVPFSSYRVNG